MPRFLGPVPSALEDELLYHFKEIERNYRERRWEPSELNGGKLCEVAYSILRGYVDGSFPQRASKPPNFLSACNDLSKAPSSVGRSIRIQIPRMLIALYEIRNNRNVGHVGGDVDPNYMDAICVLHIAKWVVAEFIRVFHDISLDESRNIIESISERDIPLIWDTGTTRRVLDNSLTMLEKTLLLLYSSTTPITEDSLIKNLEHSNRSVYRRDILRKSHRKRLIEYSETTKESTISPLGIRMVEDLILPKAKI